MDSDFVLKIILIGDSDTGKTSLMNRFIDTNWSDRSANTIAVDFRYKIISTTWDDQVKKIKVQFYDTAGQERFKAIRSAYYRTANIAIITYDTTERKTFLNIKYWLDELLKYRENSMPRFLVGTKSDLEENRMVTFEEGSNLAKEIGATYFELSAKKNINLDNLMEAIIAKFLKMLADPYFYVEGTQLNLTEPTKKKTCCKK